MAYSILDEEEVTCFVSEKELAKIIHQALFTAPPV